VAREQTRGGSVGEIVAGIGMSHAPGMLGWPDAPKPDMRERIAEAVARTRAYLDAARCDVIVAFLDDHFDNHFRNLMPALSIGVAPSHGGPGEHYLEMLRLPRKEPVPSSPELAEAMLHDLVADGFDVARMGEIEYGNNLMVPLHLIRSALDIPVVPVFINVFTPPLTPVHRAYALGEAVRRSLASRSERIAILATGGLSHWPPIWNERSDPDDDFLARMKRFQTEGRSVLDEDADLLTDLGLYEEEMAAKQSQPLVNADWDREFLDALGSGDVAYMRALTYDEVEEKAGHGGHEILNWVALMGAMGGAPATVLTYEAVIEWICGIGFAIYGH
jgi:2,3-dihydroxyphenylpropionate 1,2-dioxygenase